MSKCVTCKLDKDKWSDENEYAQCEICSMVDYFNQENERGQIAPFRFDNIGEQFLDDQPTNSFHPTKTGLINLYEVVDAAGNALWGGDSGYEAIKQFRNSPVNCRLLVSGWDSDTENARLVGQTLDITSAVVSAIAFSRE